MFSTSSKILIILISTFLITSIFVEPVNKLGLRFNIVDIPNSRKTHSKKIVRVGGLAIFLGLITSSLIFSYIGWINIDLFEYQKITFILFFTLCVFLIGLTDDINSISPFSRLIFQVIISCGIWDKLISIKAIDLSFLSPNLGTYDLPASLSLILTILIIVSMINSYNWQDGLDGLAAGGALLSATGFSFIILCLTSNTSEVLYIWIFSGACLGFLRFNYYPSKILMGDSGSYLIGLNLAIFACISYDYLIKSEYSQYSILIPILILFVPMIDMCFVIFSRIAEKRSPFFPDGRHLHYKLRRLGFSHPNSVLVCLLLNQWFICLAITIVFNEYWYTSLISSLFIILFIIFKFKEVNILIRNSISKIKSKE